MNGLGPSDKEGNYIRPQSKFLSISDNELILDNEEEWQIIIGRTCPWAHRVWIMSNLLNIPKSNLTKAIPNTISGKWEFESKWHGYNNIAEIYNQNSSSRHRATLPILGKFSKSKGHLLRILCNESLSILEILNNIAKPNNGLNLIPYEKEEETKILTQLIHKKINNGVYKCGFARNQRAYELASDELFCFLDELENKIKKQGPWLLGECLTIADICLFSTLIRWETIYLPLFKCSKSNLYDYANLLSWLKRFYSLEGIAKTCEFNFWVKDYYEAMFPLNPSNIIPIASSIPKFLIK
tara:strand:+ start:1900 stop:2790 length:891 start_codon:yes stop_codon:yes gene_type:complete